MTKLVRPLLFVFVAMSVLLAACGAPATAAPQPTEAPKPTAVPPTTAPTVATTTDPMAMYAPDAVTGDIVTAGSSTVFPLSERMSELFQQEGYTSNITVDSIGTGAGFERFCKTGETDISNASRKIKDSEVEACKALATPRDPIGFRVGTDALTVVISADNDFVTALTKEQLGKIFTAQYTKWNEVDPAFPAETILVYGPGADSGTFDYFNEVIVSPLYPDAAGKADIAAGKAALLGAPGAQFSEDDNVLVQGVEGSKYAIGYFGFAYFNENKGKLKSVAVEGVEPSQATVDDGTYPISRPLFIYSDANIMKAKPQVAAFIYFYLNNVDNEISDVGYFPAPAADLQNSLDAWLSVVGE
ncbi:MAG TPA: PstS family phosphate ABC transporter substrate-binding protein [Anaerolineales bacterium]|nr:PstS family phosphate ABC transporter substrate-binding protein [Anaerolineales bacterium]